MKIEFEITGKKIILPAGKYYIGDPCYVLDNWDAALDDSNYFEKPLLRDGKVVIAFQTAYVPARRLAGVYSDQNKRTYPVDAGLIGAVPIELVKREQTDLGHVFEFEHDFICETNGKILRFGYIRIDTE